jgi:hypothetical protein
MIGKGKSMALGAHITIVSTYVRVADALAPGDKPHALLTINPAHVAEQRINMADLALY